MWMVGIIADLGTYTRNTHINGTILAVVLDATQVVEDFFACEDSTRVAGQQPQQVEFGTGQINARSLQPRLAGSAVDFKITETEPTVTSMIHNLCPPQQGAHTRQQYAWLNRLGHVVIGSHLQSQHLVHVI